MAHEPSSESETNTDSTPPDTGAAAYNPRGPLPSPPEKRVDTSFGEFLSSTIRDEQVAAADATIRWLAEAMEAIEMANLQAREALNVANTLSNAGEAAERSTAAIFARRFEAIRHANEKAIYALLQGIIEADQTLAIAGGQRKREETAEEQEAAAILARVVERLPVEEALTDKLLQRYAL